MGTRCADHATPLYPQKLALISPTGGGRSVGIVRSQTKATVFSLVLLKTTEAFNSIERYINVLRSEGRLGHRELVEARPPTSTLFKIHCNIILLSTFS